MLCRLRAHLAGEAMAVPGAASSTGYAREANGFGAHGFAMPQSALGPPPRELAELEDIYARAAPGRPPGFAPGRHGPPLMPFLHVRTPGRP